MYYPRIGSARKKPFFHLFLCRLHEKSFLFCLFLSVQALKKEMMPEKIHQEAGMAIVHEKST